MSFFIVVCALSVILSLLSSLLYILRLREIKLNIIGRFKWLILTLKCIVMPFSLTLLTIVCLNTQFFTYNRENLTRSPFVFISLLCILSSIIIFIRSYKISPKYEIELDKPSRLKSRMGTINLGRILSKNKKKIQIFS